MTRYCIRHATRDEVYTHNGFMPRERETAKGKVVDDYSAMTFRTEEDAMLFLERQGEQWRGHIITQYEEKGEQELGVGKISAEDFFGVRS